MPSAPRGQKPPSEAAFGQEFLGGSVGTELSGLRAVLILIMVSLRVEVGVRWIPDPKHRKEGETHHGKIVTRQPVFTNAS